MVPHPQPVIRTMIVGWEHRKDITNEYIGFLCIRNYPYVYPTHGSARIFCGSSEFRLVSKLGSVC
ncbi:hypothetical protein NQ317_001118 [Molorchus minor]|uniref:Uncharacterized protein n=1 Tax=Molorchus minor TaxID=1323400 RepID=A0ABQ9JJG6_9CUCU|nr:hypothetical protein NQ317_001118 [Molorchus minor]